MNTLKQKAIALGLCDDFQKSWSEDLIGMYKGGIDWCLKKSYPSLEDMLPYDEMLIENDVYNSKNIDLILTGDTYIFNESVGKLEINDYNVARAYFGLNSNFKIIAKGESYLWLDLYNNSNIQISVEGNANVTACCYGNSVVQVLSGKVKIFKK